MSTKTIFIAVAILGALFFVVPMFAKSNEGIDESGKGISSCINVPSHLEDWDEDGDWNGNGSQYVMEKYGSKHKDYDLVNEDHVVQYAAGFMKALGLKYTTSNVKHYEAQMVAYLKGSDKAPHWDETKGRLRCG